MAFVGLRARPSHSSGREAPGRDRSPRFRQQSTVRRLLSSSAAHAPRPDGRRLATNRPPANRETRRLVRAKRALALPRAFYSAWQRDARVARQPTPRR